MAAASRGEEKKGERRGEERSGEERARDETQGKSLQVDIFFAAGEGNST